MAGTRSRRRRLPPARHPGVVEFRVARQAILRAESQSFHDAGAETFEHGICVVGQPLYQLLRIRVLEIDAEVFPRLATALRPPPKSCELGAARRSNRVAVAATCRRAACRKGPGPMPANSTTLMPASGPFYVGLCVLFP